MKTYALKTKKKFEITARSIAFLFGITMLFLFFLNLLNYQIPGPKPGEFGAVIIPVDSEIYSKKKAKPSNPAKEEKKEAEKTKETSPKKAKPKKTTIKKEVVTDDRSKVLPVKKEKSSDAKEAEEVNVESESTNKTDAAEKKEEASKIKDGIKNAFDTGTDNTEVSDDEGETGATTAESGQVGGALGSRGGQGPKVNDSSQATGVVVVKICVDENGKVISAKYTQSGSNTTDAQLRKLAESNAKKWTFEKGNIDKQCGTITYEFKVK